MMGCNIGTGLNWVPAFSRWLVTVVECRAAGGGGGGGGSAGNSVMESFSVAAAAAAQRHCHISLLCEGILLTPRRPRRSLPRPVLRSFGRPIQTAVLVINEPQPALPAAAAVSQVSSWLFSDKSTVTSGRVGRRYHRTRTAFLVFPLPPKPQKAGPSSNHWLLNESQSTALKNLSRCLQSTCSRIPFGRCSSRTAFD